MSLKQRRGFDTPVTKVLLGTILFCSLSPISVSYSQSHSQSQSILTNLLVTSTATLTYPSPTSTLFACLCLWQLRSLERIYGRRKFLSFLSIVLGSCLLSSFVASLCDSSCRSLFLRGTGGGRGLGVVRGTLGWALIRVGMGVVPSPPLFPLHAPRSSSWSSTSLSAPTISCTTDANTNTDANANTNTNTTRNTNESSTRKDSSNEWTSELKTILNGILTTNAILPLLLFSSLFLPSSTSSLSPSPPSAAFSASSSSSLSQTLIHGYGIWEGRNIGSLAGAGIGWLIGSFWISGAFGIQNACLPSWSVSLFGNKTVNALGIAEEAQDRGTDIAPIRTVDTPQGQGQQDRGEERGQNMQEIETIMAMMSLSREIAENALTMAGGSLERAVENLLSS